MERARIIVPDAHRAAVTLLHCYAVTLLRCYLSRRVAPFVGASATQFMTPGFPSFYIRLDADRITHLALIEFQL